MPLQKSQLRKFSTLALKNFRPIILFRWKFCSTSLRSTLKPGLCNKVFQIDFTLKECNQRVTRGKLSKSKSLKKKVELKFLQASHTQLWKCNNFIFFVFLSFFSSLFVSTYFGLKEVKYFSRKFFIAQRMEEGERK